MRHNYKIFAVAVMGLFVVAGCYAQSLGDVARAQREKQAQADQGKDKDATAKHKVITNEDMPESVEPASSTSVSTDKHDAAPATSAANDSHSAEQWKSKIEAQKSSVASLQSQIDSLNSSIHFAPGNCVANCVAYNEQQVNKQEEVERMQNQLNEQKQKLEDMQESARKAGLGSSVYEP
jgi:predicted RNase H-like nuclease (RuvC/YqgF family)